MLEHVASLIQGIAKPFHLLGVLRHGMLESFFLKTQRFCLSDGCLVLLQSVLEVLKLIFECFLAGEPHFNFRFVCLIGDMQFLSQLRQKVLRLDELFLSLCPLALDAIEEGL